MIEAETRFSNPSEMFSWRQAAGPRRAGDHAVPGPPAKSTPGEGPRLTGVSLQRADVTKYRRSGCVDQTTTWRQPRAGVLPDFLKLALHVPAFSPTGRICFWRATLRSGGDQGSQGNRPKCRRTGSRPDRAPSHAPVSRPYSVCPTRARYKRKDPGAGLGGSAGGHGIPTPPQPPNPLLRGAGFPTENKINQDQTFR